MQVTDHDYTKDNVVTVRTYDGETPFDDSGDDIGDYQIDEGVVSPIHDADEIAAERGFKQLPVGTWQVEVLGFLKPKDGNSVIVRKWRDAFFGDKKVSYQADSVTVKFGAIPGQIAKVPVDDPSTGETTTKEVRLDNSYQTLDTFILPPGDPDHQRCYSEGTPKINQGASQKGTNRDKFFHFIERLGFPYPKGGALPSEARNLKNWKGKKIILEIVPGRTTLDQTTGKKETYKPGIGFFSYQMHPDTVKGFQRAAERVSSVPRPARQPQPAEQPRPRAVADPAGLADI